MSKRILFLATVLWLLLTVLFGAAWRADAVPVDYVVDGDTIRLDSGTYVRMIGVDTPEVGQCGYYAAKGKLARMVRNNGGHVGLGNPEGVDDTDRYGRLLRYVWVGKDAGKVLIRKGLADARYDSRDGYDWHPREDRYHEIDATHPDICP